jgi:hypothetical protein
MSYVTTPATLATLAAQVAAGRRAVGPNYTAQELAKIKTMLARRTT